MKVTVRLKRYYRWKYSGPITVISGFALAVLIWYVATNDIAFYDKFTCPQMIDYHQDKQRRVGVPTYYELSIDDQNRIDIEVKRCVEMGWSPEIGK